MNFIQILDLGQRFGRFNHGIFRFGHEIFNPWIRPGIWNEQGESMLGTSREQPFSRHRFLEGKHLRRKGVA